MVICPNCKKRVRKADKFCRYCGNETIIKPEVESEKKITSKKPALTLSKTKYIAIGAVVVIAFILGVIFFIQKPTQSPIVQTVSKPIQGQLALAFENGEVVNPDRVLLDGNNAQISEGKIDISELTKGSHTITISISGLEYAEDFYYEGEGVAITIKKPIETFVAVFSQELNQPISNVVIYSDGENKCTTGSDGTCSFFAKSDKHTIRLQGEGIFYEEIKTIASNSNSFTFKVSRTLFADIKVKDELTNNPIENVEIYLDGTYKGKTNSLGAFKITDIKEGSHSLEINYKTVSKSQNIQVSFTQTNFEVKIKAPRTVELMIKDKETGKAVKDVRTYLNGIEKGITTQEGTLKLVDILPDNYRVTVDISGYGTLDAGYMDITTQQQITTSVDMPNPILLPTATMVWNAWSTAVKCSIKALNTGNIATKGPVALCLVYEIVNNTPILKGSDSILFANIASNSESPYKETKEISVPWNPLTKEDIVIIFFDTYDYLPSQQETLTLQTSSSFASQVLQDVYNYCSASPEKCAEIAGTFVGSILKSH
jgi:hypothetical protein